MCVCVYCIVLYVVVACGYRYIKKEEKKVAIKKKRKRKIVKRCWTDRCGIREKRVNHKQTGWLVRRGGGGGVVVVEHNYVHKYASERSRGSWGTDRCGGHPFGRYLCRSFMCVVVVVVIHNYLLQSSPVQSSPCCGCVVCCDIHSHWRTVKQGVQLLWRHITVGTRENTVNTPCSGSWFGTVKVRARIFSVREASRECAVQCCAVLAVLAVEGNGKWTMNIASETGPAQKESL